MLSNYLRTAWRTFNRVRGFWLLNIGGLALGIACCLLIGLFIADELSYDRYHSQSDRIYRVTTELSGEGDGENSHLASSVYALRPALEEVEGIARSVRFFGNHLASTLVSHGETRLNVTGIFAADAPVFEIFDFNLLRGDPATALERPHTVVLSESAARTIFGEEDPMGQSLTIRSEAYEITGVMEDVPDQSHFAFDYLTSFSTLTSQSHFREHGWNLLGFYTYILLEEQAGADIVSRQINALEGGENQAFPHTYYLQPLTDIHLRSRLSGEIKANGDIRYIWLFGTVALLVLAVACVNYINLTTALAGRRLKQVGVRKVMGARSGHLFWQFLTESIVISLAALVVSILMVEAVMPWFNAVAQKSLSLSLGQTGGYLFLLALAVGILAGGYPAAAYARVRAMKAFSGRISATTGGSREWLRNSLVVFQFSVSIALVTGAIIVQRQLDYVQEERLGFDKENLVVLHKTQQLGESYGALKESLLGQAGIIGVTTSTNVPGQLIFNEFGMRPDDADPYYLTFNLVDADFVETVGLEIAAGRDLDPERSTDPGQAILVNEATVRQMGWEDPLEETLFNRQVVGVIGDYLTRSAGEPVKPASYILGEGPERFVAVRISGGNTQETLSRIDETWDRFVPSAPLDFSFADADIEALYRSEQRLGRIFIAFTLLAILVACLGLFGLAAYSAERRTREIGIRKVLGASVTDILALLNRKFVALVLAGLVIGGPVAWVAMNTWLEDFVYRVEPGVGVVATAGAAALLVALVSVSWQSLRAALSNPVESLRSE